MPKFYLHDLTTTDRRKPTVNPYGLIYGAAELSTDDQPVFDPVKITKSVLKVPVRDADAPSSALANKVGAPSPYFGTEQVWEALRALHLVGQLDDLDAVRPYERDLPDISNDVRQQAQETEKAIRDTSSTK